MSKGYFFSLSTNTSRWLKNTEKICTLICLSELSIQQYLKCSCSWKFSVIKHCRVYCMWHLCILYICSVGHKRNICYIQALAKQVHTIPIKHITAREISVYFRLYQSWVYHGFLKPAHLPWCTTGQQQRWRRQNIMVVPTVPQAHHLCLCNYVFPKGGDRSYIVQV